MGSDLGKSNQEPQPESGSAPVQETELPPDAASKFAAGSFLSALIVIALLFLLAFVWINDSTFILWLVFSVLTLILMWVSRHNWWPWIALLTLALVVFSGVPRSDTATPSPTPTMGATRLVPVPSSKLQPGTGLLIPNHIIDLTVTVPVEGQPPQRYVFQNIRVDQLLGDYGPVSVFQRSDIKTIVLAVPAHLADELQSVLALEESTIAYSLLPTPSAATPEMSDTSLAVKEDETAAASQATVAPSPVKVFISIPIDALTIGTGPLAVGDSVEVFVYETTGAGTPAPTPASFPNLIVARLLSDAGPVSAINWNAVRRVIVEVSVQEAPILEAAVSKENATILYRKLEGTATPTVMVTATETTPTFTLTPHLTRLAIPVASLQPPNASLPAGSKARLVIVVRPGQDAASGTGTPTTNTTAQEFCVTVPTGTPQNGSVTPESGSATPESRSLTFDLPISDLARYAESITAAAAIYLVADPDCAVQPK